ncbi:TetR/AcrR family transcriptional regulator [Micromonospora chokoriensis]
MVGRPRGFDRQEALEKAMRAFWRHGFEGVSIADLSAAIGINPPSLYAAFGNKRALFDEAVSIYTAGLDESLTRDMSAPTARAAVERLLASAIAHFGAPETPPGCLVMSEPLLEERRTETRRVVRIRLDQAVIDGELPADEVDELAAYLDTVLAGLAARARDGATRAELERASSLALKAWPHRDEP